MSNSMITSKVIHLTAKRKTVKRVRSRMKARQFKSLESFARSNGAKEADLGVMVLLDSDLDRKAVSKVVGFVAHEAGLTVQEALKAWPEIRACLKQLPCK